MNTLYKKTAFIELINQLHRKATSFCDSGLSAFRLFALPIRKCSYTTDIQLSKASNRGAVTYRDVDSTEDKNKLSDQIKLDSLGIVLSRTLLKKDSLPLILALISAYYYNGQPDGKSYLQRSGYTPKNMLLNEAMHGKSTAF